MPKRKKKAVQVTDDCGETQKKVKTSPGDIADSPTAGPHFVIEHCKSWSVYKRNAVRVGALLSAQYPDIPIVMNPGKPRSKSFEVTYFPGTTPEEGEEEGSTSTSIWSGLKLGPPRKLKFVEDSKLVELLKENMKWCGILEFLYDDLSLNLYGDLGLIAIPLVLLIWMDYLCFILLTYFTIYILDRRFLNTS